MLTQDNINLIIDDHLPVRNDVQRLRVMERLADAIDPEEGPHLGDIQRLTKLKQFLGECAEQMKPRSVEDELFTSKKSSHA